MNWMKESIKKTLSIIIYSRVYKIISGSSLFKRMISKSCLFCRWIMIDWPRRYWIWKNRIIIWRQARRRKSMSWEICSNTKYQSSITKRILFSSKLTNLKRIIKTKLKNKNLKPFNLWKDSYLLWPQHLKPRKTNFYSWRRQWKAQPLSAGIWESNFWNKSKSEESSKLIFLSWKTQGWSWNTK